MHWSWDADPERVSTKAEAVCFLQEACPGVTHQTLILAEGKVNKGHFPPVKVHRNFWDPPDTPERGNRQNDKLKVNNPPLVHLCHLQKQTV